MNKLIKFIFLLIFFSTPALAVEVAPRISDREIVEKLSRLEEGQRSIEKRIDNLDISLNKRIDELSLSTNKRFDDLRSEMNGRFNTIQWMFGFFITIALTLLGFILRMLWLMQKKHTEIEATIAIQKDEIAFIKRLIEKLLPPPRVL